MREAPVSVSTFIVGTGRCGSTMLSNMLRDHPEILSLSEFFSMITDGDQSQEPFSPEPMDGERFWSIVAATGRFYTFFLRHDLAFPELLYPTDAPGSRFSSRTGVPGILLTALPHLTDGHDALFDQLGEEVRAWPRAAIGEHYRRLFGRLAQRFGRRRWVERSGALLYVERLLSIFPDGRFVHIVRDGRDAALSMQNHDAWRLGLTWQGIAEVLGVNPFDSPDRTHLDRVPAELRSFLPEHFDLEAFRAYQAPLPACAGFWNYQLEVGLGLLGDLPADRVLTLRYEDFFIDPKAQLDKLAAFIGHELVDEDWSARCAATVRTPRSSWRNLPQEAAYSLTEACRPGFERLNEAGVHYPV
jgi:putative sulfotransferase